MLGIAPETKSAPLAFGRRQLVAVGHRGMFVRRAKVSWRCHGVGSPGSVITMKSMVIPVEKPGGKGEVMAVKELNADKESILWHNHTLSWPATFENLS